MICTKIIISEYNQTCHTSSSCCYILDLLCVTVFISHQKVEFSMSYLTTFCSKCVHAMVPIDGVKVQKFDHGEKGDFKC